MLLALVLYFGWPPSLGAAPRAMVNASWIGEPDAPKLAIALDKVLSPRQIKLIHSGFATVSELTLFFGEVRADPLARVRCHVEFDTWAEQYRITLLTENARSGVKTVKTFARYAELCLNVELAAGPRLNALRQGGGVIQGMLQMNQLSGEQKAHLREWMVKQQSGVMQELFAHMLGDISITEDVDVSVTVPPYSGVGGANP